MLNTLLGYFFATLIVGFWGFIIWGGLRSGSTKAIIRQAQADNRYELVNIDGKQYHAIRKKETLLRSSAGRGLAILVSVGRERDPNMVNGKTKMLPRWIKIRSVTKKGLSENERWVSATGWSYYGDKEIYYHIPVREKEQSSVN
jgi:hypothetical protein